MNPDEVGSRGARTEDALMDRWAKLRIVHIVRAPIGGIFRHIVDLADAQAKAGHDVGIICDSLTGGQFESDIIAKAAQRLALAATRSPTRRAGSLSDIGAA